jgi:tetratricopeptide (TPR) repeat protein
MKLISFLVFFLIGNYAFSQNYFEGKNLYCKSENAQAIEKFNNGIEILKLNYDLKPKYLAINSTIFFDALKIDKTFCDAYFFVGYTLRLQNKMDLALKYYYMADSLSQNKSIEFKQNLAVTALLLGKDKLSRKKYSEIIEFFPESPEGYYGFALTSPILGDVDKGLENLNLAIEKHTNSGSKIKDDVLFLKGVLLTLNKKHEESIEYFEKTYSTYKRDQNYNIHYSLSLLKVSELRKDEKMKQKALKYYDKIEHKEDIAKEIKEQLVF